MPNQCAVCGTEVEQSKVYCSECQIGQFLDEENTFQVEPPELDAGSLLVDGRFTLGKKIGQGTSTAVYSATDRYRSEEVVTLKITEKIHGRSKYPCPS